MTSSKPYTDTSEVLDKLSAYAEKSKAGDTVALEEMTAFDWDRVHIFLASTEANVINTAVGQTLLPADTYYGETGSLMVFTLKDQVAHAMVFTPPLYFYQGSRYSYTREEAVVEMESDGHFHFTKVPADA